MNSVVVNIPQKLLTPAENETFSGLFNAGVVNAGPDVYDFKTPLTWNVVISNTGDGLLATGTVQGSGRVNCSRCLEPYDQSITGEVEGFFVLPDKPAPKDMEGDEYEILEDTEHLDLAPAMMQAIRMALPRVPLCREDCKGLCPICGTNLNYHTCDCAENAAKKAEAERKAESPFAVLSQLEFDENGKVIGKKTPATPGKDNVKDTSENDSDAFLESQSDTSSAFYSEDVPDFDEIPDLNDTNHPQNEK